MKQKLVLILILGYFLSGCDRPVREDIPTKSQEVASPWAEDEAAVKKMVDRFLVAAGNYDIAAMDEMILDNANIGMSSLRDGQWANSSITISEFLESVKNRSGRPYYEPVNEYIVHINEGQLAFVWADAILHSFGVPRSRNIDIFTLVKIAGEWKFINLSYTSNPLPEEQQLFDLEVFAKSYSQAWSGVRPEFVAMFFAEDGSLRINDGEASVGRAAITEVAQSFMTDLPDMVVRYDSLVKTDTGANFYWTLLATNTGPGGTGNKVNVQGYEEWILSEDGLVQTSQGHFPSEEYARQLKGE